MAVATSSSIAETYARDGFVFPIDVVSEAEAKAARADLEAAEAELADDAEKLALLRSYPDRLLPSFDRLVRNPALIAAVSEVMGPDLMVWSSGLFIKEANSPKIVSWHQDLTYWGMDGSDHEITAWLALSPATAASGCMRFVPGSHTQALVPHEDTFAEDNMLSRGQEIAVEVDENQAADVALKAGEFSLHHVLLAHGSHPSTSDDRRIGLALRYITPDMRQPDAPKDYALLMAGGDPGRHFELLSPPKSLLHPADLAKAREIYEAQHGIFYRDAKGAA